MNSNYQKINNTLPSIKKIAFISLGCPKNLVDSEKMLGLLTSDGFIPVSDHAEADAIIINTCGFLEAAKQESIDTITQAAQYKGNGNLKRLIVAGCLVQRYRAKLLEWCPEIDSMIGVFDRDRIISAVKGNTSDYQPNSETNHEILPAYWISKNAVIAAQNRGLQTTNLTVQGKQGSKGIGYYESDSARFRLTPRHYAYLRMSEGCNQNCTFCTIPSIRGKMRSKPIDAIINETKELIEDGTFEINLIGQDTTSYGVDINYQPGLSGLLTELNNTVQQYGGAWIRLMYAYPSCFTDEMIDTIASLDNVVKYIDMPLQHINDRILKSMRRYTSRKQIENLLDKLRDKIPGIAIRTTFITGFPGETDAEHQELLDFISEFGFDMLGAFEYSPEPGTPAYNLYSDPNLAIPKEVSAQRYAELMTTQQQIAFEQNQYLASFYKDYQTKNPAKALSEGLQFDVLIDCKTHSPIPNNQTPSTNLKATYKYAGRCYHQAPQVDTITYVVSQNQLSNGELVRCIVVDSCEYDLIAKPLVDIDKKISLRVI